MTRETRKLLARRYLSDASLAEFVDWAVVLLEAGQDTDHLRMLASLGHAPNRADVAYYFEHSLNELGWEVPEPYFLIRHYAQDLAQDIVDGTTAPIEGCHQMYSLYCRLDSPVAMQVWLYLDDQLEQGTYRELEGAEWEAAIRRAAQEFQPIEPEP